MERNFKVICTKSNGGLFTKGEVYSFTNGVAIMDNEKRTAMYNNFNDFMYSVSHGGEYDFEELKEE